MRKVFTLILLLAGLPLWAQQIPINPKPGKVSGEEVSMTGYAPDTSATALILYEKRWISVDVGASLTQERRMEVYRRIKILKEDGKSYADFKLAYDVDSERILGIKVTTYNEENGKVKSTKLDRKYIFTENVTGSLNTVSFSAADVRVGSVVEVSYTLSSDRYWDVGDIFFQYGIPVNRMDLLFDYAEFYTFNKATHGRVPIDYKYDSAPVTVPLGTNPLTYTLYTDSYSVHDVPAFKDTGYCYCPDLYRASVSYELSRFSVVGVVDRHYSMEWTDVDAAIRKSDIFKECKARCKYVEEYKAALDGLENEAEKLAAVRNAVIAKVEWNKQRGLVPESSSKAYKEGRAGSATLNALLSSALNELGFKANPVMVKSRTDGMLVDFYVSTDAFSTFILQVEAPSGKIYYMDAASPSGYVNVLPPALLADKARLIPLDGSAATWVDLSSLTRNTIGVTASETLSPDGEAEGHSLIMAFNECSYEIRDHALSFSSEEEQIKDIEEDEHLEITSFSCDKEEYRSSTKLEYDYTREHASSGDRIYWKPFHTAFHTDAAFRSPERSIPIEFPFKESIQYQMMLTIPEGYAVESLPESASVRCEGAAISYQFQVRNSAAGVLSVLFRYQNNEMFLQPEGYPSLRDFWGRLCDVYNTTIVLRKQ